MKARPLTTRFVVLLGSFLIFTPTLGPKSAFSQSKVRIAVTAFENKVKTPWGDPSWRIGEGLAEMLTTELVKTGRFTVVERLALGDVVREQQLSQSGLISRGSGVGTGQILGAQYVVRGAVTEFEHRASGGGAGIGVTQFQIEGNIQNGHVAVDIRIIDTSTGQVVASHHAAKVVPGGGGAFAAQAGTVNFGGDLFFRTPIGQATRGAIQDALQFILMTRLKAAPRSFSIVKVDRRQVYINAGANMGVKIGDLFTVYSKGEELVDPETGINLGSTEQITGLVEITRVEPKYSIGVIRRGAGAMKRGDLVKDR